MGRGQKVTLVFVSIFLSHFCWTWQEELIMDYYTNTYKVLCSDNCETRGYNYRWCNSRKGWDYCGRMEPKTLLHMSTTYQSVCRDECLYYELENYFWCNTDEGWDYCSPLPDVTYRNVPCRSDHFCDTHNESYTWCWTDSGWDYCGPINPNECRYTFTGRKRKKRQPNNLELICTRSDRYNRKETRFYAAPADTEIMDGHQWVNEIRKLISRWSNRHLGNQARARIITSENFRIDLQGLVTRNNQQYYNLQIQRNVPRPNKMTTTVAQVLIPLNAEIPDRYVHRALLLSLRRHARIFVEFNSYYTNVFSHD